MHRPPSPRAIASLLVGLACWAAHDCSARDFEITYALQNPADFTSEQADLLLAAMEQASQLWESVILGHESSEQDVLFPVEVLASNEGLASGGPQGTVSSGEFVVSTGGRVWINPAQIVPATDGFGFAPGTNVLDELMAHEIGHTLGIGSLWTINDVYTSGSGEYLGPFGLAAYREEFDPEATFVPVELAGGAGSANSHWNQLFRSSPEEGNPNDPLSLSPLTGIVDAWGRDFAQTLMSPAIDPDYGEPFLSTTTVQSLRDLGYATVTDVDVLPADYNGNGGVEQGDLDLVLLNWGVETPPIPETWLQDLPEGQIDQAELDAVLLDWGNTAALAAQSVPEPGSWAMAAWALAMLAANCRRRQ